MKRMILTGLTLLAFAAMTMASEPEKLSIKVGQQKTSLKGKITISVAEVLEDSRCPVGVNCVWAGNAKLKITLAKSKRAAKTFELNSTLDPNMILFEGYEIRFVDLTPRPGEMVKAVAMPKVATFSVTKHRR